MTINNFHAVHNYICYFVQYPQVKFTSRTGGLKSRDANIQHDGSGNTEVVTGPSTTEPVTVGKPYNTILDAPIRAHCMAALDGVADITLDLVAQRVDSRNLAIGIPVTYKDSKVVSFKDPEQETGSGGTAMMEIVIQPRRST